MRTIVISAVNLNVGGTLTILRDCLAYLSTLAANGKYRIVAIVYQRELADFPHIEYLETQWPKKMWTNRLWFEYVSMKKISQQLGPVYLWLSLHDTSPNVVAERKAVYCHNPFPFYSWKMKELLLTPKIVLFALFSKFIYQKNITQNDYVIVQQHWIKKEFIKRFGLPERKVLVALPDAPELTMVPPAVPDQKPYTFIYAASANSHKNFECLFRAVERLESDGVQGFKVLVTLSGLENNYAAWLFKKWGSRLQCMAFIGFQGREDLFALYASSNCLVFPSRAETWGLPITEFRAFQKPMLLADLPYAHETAAGAAQVAFFDPDEPAQLAQYMRELMDGNTQSLKEVAALDAEGPLVAQWTDLFGLLLDDRELNVEQVPKYAGR